LASICLSLNAAPALGATTQYNYDALGRLVTVSRGAGGVSYVLDAAGNRQSMTVSTGGADVTDVLTMTQGLWTSGPVSFFGYNPSTGTGALNPSTLTGGKTITAFYDNKYNGVSLIESIFKVSGFTSDPGQAWLTSAKVNGVTRTGASAQYSYASGVAQWRWVPPATPVFGSSGNVSCTIIHK